MWQEQLHTEEVVLHIVEVVLQVHKVRKYVKHGLFGHSLHITEKTNTNNTIFLI